MGRKRHRGQNMINRQRYRDSGCRERYRHRAGGSRQSGSQARRRHSHRLRDVRRAGRAERTSQADINTSPACRSPWMTSSGRCWSSRPCRCVSLPFPCWAISDRTLAARRRLSGLRRVQCLPPPAAKLPGPATVGSNPSRLGLPPCDRQAGVEERRPASQIRQCGASRSGPAVVHHRDSVEGYLRTSPRRDAEELSRWLQPAGVEGKDPDDISRCLTATYYRTSTRF